MSAPIRIAKNEHEYSILPKMANRHGLIAGATGTGKTVTLQSLAEGFSRQGVPVFMADIKGDLAGIARCGGGNVKLEERRQLLKMTDTPYQAFPVTFWDVFAKKGHPVRASVSEMGPHLIGRLLDLNEVQTGVLHIIFKIADDNGLLLLDLKDLKAITQYVGENAAEFTVAYGNISKASVGAIQRGLMELAMQGAESFFGEPALNIFDLIQVDSSGQGMVNILASQELFLKPKIYATFLLWLLSELFEQLPEVGDIEKPKLVFFFDEAHLLFDGTPDALLEKIEQVVRLIRSKGVGVYFITQNPRDIPDKIAAQLGNRIQHALRAFTPQDQKAIKAMAQTFRVNPKLKIEEVITQLGLGEALVSLLDEQGSPSIVERAFICPPLSRVGTLSDEEQQAVIKASLKYGRYEKAQDRESAYEILSKRAQEKAKESPVVTKEPSGRSQEPSKTPARRGRPPDSLVTAMAKSAARSVGSQIGRQIIRGVLGSIFGGRR